MTDMTVREIERLTGGTLYGSGQGEVSSVVIDSRAVCPGSLFAALPGEKADGHDFIAAAFDKGAACCLALRVPEGETRPIVVVDDVAQAIKELARQYRERFNIPVIGIAGSVGKTTTKEMVACVLQSRFEVLKTEKNLNNELGVPLTLFRLEPKHQAAVIEMGISDFGEMTRLAKMAQPTMAVYTVIGHSHLERLHDRKGVLLAKTEMLDYMPADGTVVVNGDDDLLFGLDCGREKLCYGLGKDNAIRAENIITDDPSKTTCNIVCGERRIPVVIPSYGRQLVYAALAGAAVGIKMGLDDGEIARGIAAYETVGRRANVLSTGGITIIDDCYNSNPDSVRCGIDSMAGLDGRRVCILGDMLELGENTGELHRQVGEYAVKNGVSLVLTAGGLSENIHAGALTAGGEARHFADTAALTQALPKLIKKGDVVLVKASHAMKFDAVSDALKELKL